MCFLAEGQTHVDATKALHGEDIAKLSKEKAVFVLVDFNPDRTPGLNDGSPVPRSKLESSNLSREFDIRATPCWIITDQFGNEFNRFSKAPEGGKLAGSIDGIQAQVDAINTRLGKTLDEARKLLEAKDTAGFLKAAMKNFREGVVGLQAQEDTIKAYKQTLDAAREEVDQILEDRPKNAEKRLKEMLKTFKGTEVHAKIKDAIEIVEG